MPYNFYNLLHLFGIFLVLASLGGVFHHVLTGGSKASDPVRKISMMMHGVGLLLVLVSGFGMLAKLQIFSFPLWVIFKFVIWLVLGASVTLVFKKPQSAKAWFMLAPVLALIAGILAHMKIGG